MIFGTDGIRARIGSYPLDRQTMEHLSQVLAAWLGQDATVVIGSDTRASCDDLRAWITHAFTGISILDLGVVPTPVVAFETKARDAALGIMITASHNPAADNGLKFFNHEGLKMAYEQAQAWSQQLQELKPNAIDTQASFQSVAPDHYRQFIRDHFKPEDFSGQSMVFDLAHGAGYALVRQLCEDLEIDAVILGADPDGSNINDGVGALHPEKLRERMKETGRSAGFALDGDGDRLLVAAPEVVHGDVLLYAMHANLLVEGFSCDTLVGTIMCGMGLERTLAAKGVALIRTPVGDQNVLKAMMDGGHLLGGEPSGHLIQADLFPAGDGFLGALRVARALKRNPQLIEQAIAAVPRYPVYEKAYRVAQKPPLETVAPLHSALEELKRGLGESGRLIVRYSGTEPKLRLYVEAPDLAPHQAAITRVETAISEALS